MEILNKLINERAGLMYMFMACVGAVITFNYMGIEASVELGMLIGAFIKTFLDAVVENVKTQISEPVYMSPLPTETELDLKESLAELAK